MTPATKADLHRAVVRTYWRFQLHFSFKLIGGAR